MFNFVKVTCFHYSYILDISAHFEHIVAMPCLLDLAAMKAHALGGRAKWKDSVDLYFLLRDHYQLPEIAARAKHIFQNSFNQKLFRQQLCYFKDVDFSETVEFMTDNEASEEEMTLFLTDVTTTSF